MIQPVLARFGAVLRDGVRIWWLAPLVPLLVVVPEGAQHVAEIRLGFFESRAAAAALADDPRRMVWGYLKIAGLLMAIFAAIRFWATRGSGQAWWNPRGVAWRNLLLAIVLMGLTSVPGLVLQSSIGSEFSGWIDIALFVATLPLLALLIAGLAGDCDIGLKAVFRSGWLTALRVLVYGAAVWAPLAWLHTQNHQWAMGASEWAVWLLMAFDTLVVGLLATMAGTALHHGYSTPPNARSSEVEPAPAMASA